MGIVSILARTVGHPPELILTLGIRWVISYAQALPGDDRPEAFQRAMRDPRCAVPRTPPVEGGPQTGQLSFGWGDRPPPFGALRWRSVSSRMCVRALRSRRRGCGWAPGGRLRRTSRAPASCVSIVPSEPFVGLRRTNILGYAARDRPLPAETQTGWGLKRTARVRA